MSELSNLLGINNRRIGDSFIAEPIRKQVMAAKHAALFRFCDHVPQ